MEYLALALVKKGRTIKGSVTSTVSLLKRGLDLLYGHMDKERKIELTLESGFVCDFDPDFDLTVNSTAIEKVQWKFQHGEHSYSVADVFGESQAERLPTECILPDL